MSLDNCDETTVVAMEILTPASGETTVSHSNLLVGLHFDSSRGVC